MVPWPKCSGTWIKGQLPPWRVWTLGGSCSNHIIFFRSRGHFIYMLLLYFRLETNQLPLGAFFSGIWCYDHDVWLELGLKPHISVACSTGCPNRDMHPNHSIGYSSLVVFMGKLSLSPFFSCGFSLANLSYHDENDTHFYFYADLRETNFTVRPFLPGSLSTVFF